MCFINFNFNQTIMVKYALNVEECFIKIVFLWKFVKFPEGPPQFHAPPPPSVQHISSAQKGHSSSAPKIPQFHTRNPSAQGFRCGTEGFLVLTRRLS